MQEGNEGELNDTEFIPNTDRVRDDETAQASQ